MLTALILAGGQGTRFWPISTYDKPKQFLNLIDNKSMLQTTVDRLTSKININHIFVCTSEIYIDLVKKQLPTLPVQNIIIEPVSRNTAPCILLSTIYINQMYPNANIVVLPSDHKINNNTQFLNTLNAAEQFLNIKTQAIITIGILPTRPETGYGYIHYGETIKSIDNCSIRKVISFVEKPNLKKAQLYLDDGAFLWNAGMFIFNSHFMLSEFKQYDTSNYNMLSSLPSINDQYYVQKVKDRYLKCNSISIDYAIMEKSKNIYVMPSDFGWDDIGSWKSIERYISKDSSQNVLKGRSHIINSKQNIIYSTGKKILLLDIDNIFCIEAEDIIIIGNRESLSKVHELKERD